MPYSIDKTSPKCWTVINSDTGMIKSKCTSKKKAEAQMRLLYGIEKGWKPKKRKRGGEMCQMEKIESEDEDEGGYLERFKRKAGLLPPKARALLDKVGDETITSLTVVRTPLSSFVTTLLNVISLGAFQKAVKESPYEKMMHLAMVINGKYTTEKNEVIKFAQSNPVKSNSQTMSVPVSKKVTIRELFENGRKQMGDEKFTSYSARENNCQDFLIGLLNGLFLTDSVRSFIKQDAEQIFKKMPSLSEKVGRFLTDVGAVGERLVEGEGKRNQALKQTWRSYYAKHTKGKTFGSKAGVTAHMRELSRKWKAVKQKS